MEGELKLVTKRSRVMVLTLSFGSGHVRAAKTIAYELLRQMPDAAIGVMDALAQARSLFHAGYVWPYWALVRYAPGGWDQLFSRRLKHIHRRTAPQWAFQFGCPHAFKAIVEFEPDSIVATEVAACEIAVIAKRKGLTRARIVDVITDYEAEPVWAQPEVDTYAVGDRYVANQLVSWGAPRDKIHISGIPTAPAFFMSQDKQMMRTRYELNDTAPIVLLMGGGMGPTHMDEVAAALLESEQPIQIVALTGNDKRARYRLGRLQSSPSASLRVLGWTDDVPALMQLASAVITKPGGLTISEAAASALPLVLFDAIPGPERRNAQRVAEAGAGIWTNGPHQAAGAAMQLLRNEETRQRMSARVKTFACPEAAAKIAQLALGETAPMPIARSMTA